MTAREAKYRIWLPREAPSIQVRGKMGPEKAWMAGTASIRSAARLARVCRPPEPLGMISYNVFMLQRRKL